MAGARFSSRSPNRYDVPGDFAWFSSGELEPIESLARAALGARCARAFCGVVRSLLGVSRDRNTFSVDYSGVCVVF